MYEPFLACGPEYETGPTTGSMANEGRYRNYCDAWINSRHPSPDAGQRSLEGYFVH
jgi:hypothetical protein